MKQIYQLSDNPYSTHQFVINRIKSQKKILELGCATGYISKELIKKKNIVWGVDSDVNYLKKAGKICNKTFLFDIEKIAELKDLPHKYFDYILLMDVLEHTRNPEAILRQLKKWVKKNGEIIISLPNIANISTRLSLFSGSFSYTETGILDKTHLKFFTLQSFSELLLQNGLKLKHIEHNADLGIIPIIGRALKHIPIHIQYLITKIRPSLLCTQFIFVCSVQ